MKLIRNPYSGGADLFIICGDGGVGKSSFIESVTSEDVFVGSTLESGKNTYLELY